MDQFSDRSQYTPPLGWKYSMGGRWERRFLVPSLHAIESRLKESRGASFSWPRRAL